MVTAEILHQLISIVGAERVSTAQDVIVAKSQDALKQVFCAEAVVFPHTAEEIAAIMRLANEYKFYVTARGGGVGYTGGAVPVRGGIVLATERMNRILEINKADLVAVVEPAVTNYQLQKAVEAEGLFYPPDPSSWRESFIGGNVALNAGGPRCVKYGNTKQFVLGLDFVTPTGEIVKSGGRVPKNATGFHLESLMIGSEGMLGIITRCILRLLPLPETRRTALAVFGSASDACDCVADFTSSGILPVALELLDRTSINAIEDYEPSGLPRGAGALLIIEVDGLREAVAREAEIVRKMCRKHRAIQFREAADDAEADAIWEVRRKMSPAVARTGRIKLNHDAVVPRSRIPAMLDFVEDLSRSSGFLIPTFGHAGDGNLHINVMLQDDDESTRRRGAETVRRIFEKAVDLGGTISGEHGVGYAKAPFFDLAITPQAMDLMKTIKRAMDPNGVLNPGKVFESAMDSYQVGFVNSDQACC
ncbi:MAG TPA: FAD-linked oxidase C-terminal domain-containing protein [Blastocatellia bacterium]|jgi:glycolate oxidase|nr:FAD-linked oxidase C-terminal domain-containing protein [Blastocatellia bacterium]